LKGVFNASPNAILSFSPVMAGERIESFTLLKGNYAADAIIGKKKKNTAAKTYKTFSLNWFNGFRWTNWQRLLRKTSRCKKKYCCL
jgi:hypothetical protein